MRLCSSVTALTRLARKRFAVAGSTCVYSSSNWSISSSSCEPSWGNTRLTARCSPWSPASCSSNDGWRIDGDAQERFLELLERMGRGGHLDREPRTRQGNRPAPDRREQPGLHRARLAAAARTDHGDEPPAGAAEAEARDQPFDESFATEEVDCIDGIERSQPLVRVVERRLRLERRRP